MEDFGPTYITITDDDGINYEMEVVTRFEYLEKEYVALLPAEDDEDQENPEVNILRVIKENGEEVLEAIDDDKELQGAYEALMEIIMSDEE